MIYQDRILRIQTGADYRQRLPLDVCGALMRRVYPLFTGSLRMAMEGTSAAPGRPAGWLERASDIRFADYGHDGDDTLISLRLPMLGDAAEELYRQTEFWETRPAPEETAFEVFRHVVDAVAAKNVESSLYDRQLLSRLAHMRKVFGADIQAIHLPGTGKDTLLNPVVAETAAWMSASTPATRQVRLSGVLDMIRHSTRGFSLRLKSGEEVPGVMESGDGLTALPDFFGKAVLVMGRAVYRPSGRLLRIDAVGIEDGTGASPLFSELPSAQAERPAVSRWKISETGKRGVPAFFGTWPGDESDTEMDALMREVRGTPNFVN